MVNGDDWRYSGKAGEIARILDEAPMAASCKPTTKMVQRFPDLRGGRDFLYLDSKGEIKLIGDERPSEKIFAYLFNEQLERRTAANTIVVSEEEVPRSGIGRFLDTVSRAEGEHLVSICVMPTLTSTQYQFSIDDRQGIPTAHLAVDYKLGMSKVLRLFRELKANPLIIHDLLLRMRSVSRGGRVINPYNDFCLPSQATDEQVENYYLGCDHGEFTRTNPRFMPRFDVRIQSKSGFDKF